MTNDDGTHRASQAHLAQRAIHLVQPRTHPQWWEWAVAAAAYHLPDCDWVKDGVHGGHCACGLTGVIAKILDGRP